MMPNPTSSSDENQTSLGSGDDVAAASLRVQLMQLRDENNRLQAGLRMAPLRSEDPRWDEHGFDIWCDDMCVHWISAGRLRALATAGLPGLSAQEIQSRQGGVVVGMPPVDARLVAIVAPPGSEHSRLDPQDLSALINAPATAGLDPAELVFIEPLSMPTRWGEGDGAAHEIRDLHRMFTHYRVRIIVLPQCADRCVFDSGPTVGYLALSAHCQRILNADDDVVKAGLHLETLIDLPKTLAACRYDSPSDFERLALLLERVIARMKPVSADADGFRMLCERAQIAWLKVWYVKELAALHGSFPRRQDLKPEGIVVGVPPGKKWVVSHPWASQFHPSPSGSKMVALAQQLEALGALPEECCFIDFCGLPQASRDMPPEYHYVTGTLAPQADRTPSERERFSLALWDMSRLYAFAECEVIVLPEVEPPTIFLGGPDRWGLVNTLPYEARGWCCSEFSIARSNGRIANKHDLAVQALEDVPHGWPATVHEYEAMMREDATPKVRFTSSGDEEVVKFLFFKSCFGLTHSFFPQRVWHEHLAPQQLQLLQPPDTPAQYYMLVALQPSGTASQAQERVGAKLRALYGGLCAQSEAWRLHKQYPICLSDTNVLVQSLQAGLVHCLIWGSPGAGWEPQTPHDSVTLDQLLELWPKLRHPPAVVVVYMKYGARRAARLLCEVAKVRIVVWIQDGVYDEKTATSVLLGVVAPVLRHLHQRVARDSDISAHMLDLARPLGESVRAGCFRQPGTTDMLRWEPSLGSELSFVHTTLGGQAFPCAPPSLATTAVNDAPAAVGTSTESFELTAASADAVQLLEGLLTSGQLLRALSDNTLLAGNVMESLRGIYHDEALESECPAISVELESTVALLHELRDAILTAQFEAALSEALRVHLTVNKSRFAASYEFALLSLEQLTPHQQAKLQEMADDAPVPEVQRMRLHQVTEADQQVPMRLDFLYQPIPLQTRNVHLMAPAGGGKTFVGVHRVLSLLRSDRRAHVLWVARNKALCMFVARWVALRTPNALLQVDALQRLHFLFAPLEDGVRNVGLHAGRLNFSKPVTANRFSLVVVDEAHHIYMEPRLAQEVERHMGSGSGRATMLLLSDISQSSGKSITWPQDMRSVTLTEVVRSSKRIVAGAMSFQLGHEQKLLTQCHHGTTGPPLKTFLFNQRTLSGQVDQPQWIASYASQCMLAIRHVTNMLPSLDLHDRLAILGPDMQFVDLLRPVLLEELATMFPTRNFALVSSDIAASTVNRPQGETAEMIMLDGLDNVDGLERLIVIAVNMDAPIDSPSLEALSGRSRLYRSITRATMMFLIVNEWISGGWLEWLGCVQLQDKFDDELEKRNARPMAADAVTVACLSQSAEGALAAASPSGDTNEDPAQRTAVDGPAQQEQIPQALLPPSDTTVPALAPSSEPPVQSSSSTTSSSSSVARPLEAIVSTIWDTSSNVTATQPSASLAFLPVETLAAGEAGQEEEWISCDIDMRSRTLTGSAGTTVVLDLYESQISDPFNRLEDFRRYNDHQHIEMWNLLQGYWVLPAEDTRMHSRYGGARGFPYIGMSTVRQEPRNGHWLTMHPPNREDDDGERATVLTFSCPASGTYQVGGCGPSGLLELVLFEQRTKGPIELRVVALSQRTRTAQTLGKVIASGANHRAEAAPLAPVRLEMGDQIAFQLYAGWYVSGSRCGFWFGAARVSWSVKLRSD